MEVQAAQEAVCKAPEVVIQHAPSGLSFTHGLIVGQLSVVLLLAAFIKFFVFGDPPSPEVTASLRAAERRHRTLSHKRSLLALRASRPEQASGATHQPGQQGTHQAQQPGPSLARKKSTVLRAAPAVTVGSILSKTLYRVDSHVPESLDWFNVLVGQAIAQFRADAQHDGAIATSLTEALNGGAKPDWIDSIRITELDLGEDFPIFSNCRIIPVDEDGIAVKGTGGAGAGPGVGAAGTRQQQQRQQQLNADLAAAGGTRLQARMDVDLSDVITLGLETRLLLDYPKRLSAVLPVGLSVSVERFSGTLSVSFVPSNPEAGGRATMAFGFLDDYRLDLSVRSLVGSRSRLQDVPKIAQLIEARLHRWFDDRCVEPRFQQIELPSFWPRMKNARGGGDDDGGLAGLGGAASLGRTKGKDVAAELGEGGGMAGDASFDGIQGRLNVPQGSLRFRGRTRSDAERSMPGSLPGMTIDMSL